MSGDTDLIMVPGAPQELLELLKDMVYAGGENTKFYSSTTIERFSSLAEALGLGEMEIGDSPPNSPESHPSLAGSMSPNAFCDSPRSSSHGDEANRDMLPQSLTPSPDPGAKEIYLEPSSHLVNYHSNLNVTQIGMSLNLECHSTQ